MKDPMRKYLVPDPWHIRAREFFWRRIYCPVFGHKEMPKMHCWVCRHCWIVTRYR